MVGGLEVVEDSLGRSDFLQTFFNSGIESLGGTGAAVLRLLGV